MNPRFTLDGDDALERHLASTCEAVRTAALEIVPGERIQALLLGGGYGRGEGGVLKTQAGDRPYNDLEFYVCLRGNVFRNRKFSSAFHHLGEKLSPELGIEVEFKLSSLEKLQRERHTMFFYDLAMGHRVVTGDKNVLARIKTEAKSIPLAEATRLLMNRCSGLLFCQEKLLHDPFTTEGADFIGRNHAKAQLAFGDVVLTVLGDYHWSCRERHLRLQHVLDDVPHLSQIRCHHALGVQFKLHPQKKSGPKQSFLALQAELVAIARDLWLWLESRRLSRSITSIREYATCVHNKCPETSPIRNALINGLHFRQHAFSGGKVLRYPRERLLESLAILLWEPLTSPGLLHRVQRNLGTTGQTLPELVAAYSSIWKRFN